jgi:hypothetical protein
MDVRWADGAVRPRGVSNTMYVADTPTEPRFRDRISHRAEDPTVKLWAPRATLAMNRELGNRPPLQCACPPLGWNNAREAPRCAWPLNLSQGRQTSHPGL